MTTWRYASTAGRWRLATGALVVLSVAVWFVATGNPGGLWRLGAVVVSAELLAWGLITLLARQPGLLAIDRVPTISAATLDRFFEHGFDAELGWIRKPNTAKKDLGRYPYRIDARGSRANPGHEHLPELIGTYGDSYTFCREVEDHETWQWHLAERFGCQVLNFGVGNHGFDQGLLRLRREYPSASTPIVVMGVVPDTIARVLSVWKHYNEFGNIMAFKPRFRLAGERLELLPNPIDTREKFFALPSYLDRIQQDDYFYERRFRPEAFRFPFLASCLSNPRSLLLAPAKVLRRAGRAVPGLEDAMLALIDDHLDGGGVRQTAALFDEPEAMALLDRLVAELVAEARSRGFWPLLVITPMREDLDYIRRHRHYYRDAVDRWRQQLDVVDMVDDLLALPSGTRIYREWHLTPEANRVVGRAIGDRLAERVPQHLGQPHERTSRVSHAS